MNKPFENSDLLSCINNQIHLYLKLKTVFKTAFGYGGCLCIFIYETAYIHFELPVFGKRDICNENLNF